MPQRALFAGLVLAGATFSPIAHTAAPDTMSALLPASICHVDVPQVATDAPGTLAGWAADAQRFDGLSSFHRTVTTATPEAQAYFDQGMRWLWAFNHDEATRSFARAATIDPDCAMCFWGVALAVGPNYNLPLMLAPRGKVAFAALERANALAARASPVEQALIAALGKRYPNEDALDDDAFARVQADYASAMSQAAQSFPFDDDVVTMAAEALMTANAWRLWTLNGQPAPGTPDVLAMLEAVLARTELHPGANHYYIHAVEASPNPGQAAPEAERLGTLMPAAGHIVHMPSHIFQRVGRYAEAAEANKRAVKADLDYYARVHPLDYYPAYSAHNWQFEAFSDAAIGRSADALAATRKSRTILSDVKLSQFPGADWVMGMVYTVPARFGAWDALAAERMPDASLPGLMAAWLWARGNALAALGRIEEARAARDALADLAHSAKPTDYAGLNIAPDVYRVALLTLEGRLAGAQGKQAERIALLTEAVRDEDALAYDEPADWFVPARHLLGRALLDGGQPVEAEAVYREDLRRTPGNGWATLGLAQALAAQHRTAEASAAQADFQRIWATADVTPAYSAF